jgi:hypothetical protein
MELLDFLNRWDCRDIFSVYPHKDDAQTSELISRVALNLITPASEDSLKTTLETFKDRLSLLTKVAKLCTIIEKAHGRDRETLERALGIYDWDAGPNTNLAKEELLRCYLTNDRHLDLSDLNLTSLPACIKDLDITFLNCSHNELASLPSLPASLKLLYCSKNKLRSLPTLPRSLKVLDCSINKLTSPPIINPSLTYLDCSHNKLTSPPPLLPLRLRNFDCPNNHLKSAADCFPV